MAERAHRCLNPGFRTLAVLLIGSLLGTCVAALAASAPRDHQDCGAVKVQEPGVSKTSPGFMALPVDAGLRPISQSPPRCANVELDTDLPSADLSGDLASRAPPTRR